MAILTKQVEYAKEIDDVAVLLVTLVKDIKLKKSAVEIAADVLPKLMDAVSGVDGVSGELAANKEVALKTLGYRTGELGGILLG